ncbi:Rod shape-determining protein MreD [Streptococcus sp. DD11]|uniref:rod shape-determining protein MreD n=1 Tax=Streptococcus sp. DD11 TaxID=1777879 RepID=UPI00079596A7|nr:rod shape-determining protein MreD [Streptococcus sp. DD11]KXT77609.1 Rod shape-determining protein MreD [Streptococcus sp. DD11]
MRTIKENILTPFILFFVLLIDGQLSTFLTGLFPLGWNLVSHFILIFMIFVSINLPKNYNIVLFLGLGIIYDVYYFHTVGIALILFPVLSFLVCQAGSVMLLNRGTRFLSVITAIFLFELISFAAALILGMATVSLQIFVIYSLVPTLLLNSLILLLFQPMFEKVYL